MTDDGLFTASVLEYVGAWGRAREIPTPNGTTRKLSLFDSEVTNEIGARVGSLILRRHNWHTRQATGYARSFELLDDRGWPALVLWSVNSRSRSSTHAFSVCGPRGEVLCSLRQNDNRTLWIEVDGKQAGRIERSKDGDVSSAIARTERSRSSTLTGTPCRFT